MSANAPDPNLQHLQQARELIAKGDLQKAAQTLNKANQKWPQDPRVHMLGGLMAEKAGNLDGAFQSLRKAVALAPDWGPGLLELALLLARQNQFAEAMEKAEKVATLEPKNLQVLAGVVDIAHRAGHLEMAVRHLRRGLELVPGDPMLRQLLARDLSQLGQHDESLALWSGLVEQSPEAANRVGRVRALMAAGRVAEALPDTQALLAEAPDEALFRYYDDLAQGRTPSEQPAALMTELFDGMAELYDMHMVRSLKYQLPKQVADRLLAMFPDRRFNVLDLGCGTGLLGVCLGKPVEGFLIGVDYSRNMIAQAARHKVYERFHTVNVHDALRETPEGLYQVVAALDVFPYAGDLTDAIPHARRVLAPGGWLVLSCEAADEAGPDRVLHAGGRFAHKRSHVQALCEAAGFEAIEITDGPLYEENRNPVQGFVVWARRPDTAH
ncbi:tetratricopeptide repeat protein [Acidovorax lacteus]